VIGGDEFKERQRTVRRSIAPAATAGTSSGRSISHAANLPRNESACGVTNRFAHQASEFLARRSPTSSDTLSAAVATAMPRASAAMVTTYGVAACK